MAGAAVKVLSREAVQRLAGLADRGDNLSGVLRSFGAYMESSIQKNFDAQGRPLRWAPLSMGSKISWFEKRKSWRTKKGMMSKKGREAWSGRKVLTATGRLRRSIKSSVLANGVIIGSSNVVYAAIHQFGGQAGRGKKVFIPARPYLLFQKEDIEHFARMLNSYLLQGKIL